MKMHVLSGGRLRMRKSTFLPEADRAETIDIPVGCFLVRHAQGNVLFDTGCHPSVATDAQARWGGIAKLMMPIGGPDEHVVAELGRVGLQPDDIAIVVNSHFHSDHCGCNEYFKKATVYCHEKELAAAQVPEADKQGYLAVDWQHEMPYRTIAAEHDLFGDGRIVLVPVPGHTPGTLAALVKADKSGAFLLAADAVALRTHLERQSCPKNTWNVDLATRSLAEIARIAADGVTVVCGHDPEQWATLKKGAEAYE